MTHITNDKWKILRERMSQLGINESDITETFILGSGKGGQKVNKTHSTVQIVYNNMTIRSQKSRTRDANRFFARRELCDRITDQLGIPNKDNIKLQKAIKQKKRRKSRAKQKYHSE